MRPMFLRKVNFDPYAAFFIVLAGAIFSILLSFVGIIMIKDHTTAELMVLYPIASLISVVVMMNLGDQDPSAKAVFWVWIVISILLVVAGLIGYGILKLFGAVP